MAQVTLMAKTNNPHSKMPFLPRRHTDGHKAREKVLTSIVIKEMQSKLKCYHITLSQNGLHQRTQTMNAGKGVEKTKPPTPLVK